MINLGWVLIDGWTLLLLICAVIADLLIRFLAYGRFDSVALDIAFFTTAYSGAEFAKSVKTPEGTTWVERFGVGGLCLLVLVVLHAVFRTQAADLATDTLKRVQEHSKNRSQGFGVAKRKAVLERASDLVARSVPLTIVTKIGAESVREGKRGWREQVANFLNEFNPQEKFKEADFLLPINTRRVLLGVFILFGTIALFAPGVTFPLSA